MIVAGIGCRRGCPADTIVALVREAEACVDRRAGQLAAPAFKQDEPGLHEAAAFLGLPLVFAPEAMLIAMQPFCPTRSTAARRASGLSSVAEAAALAVSGGGPLLLPRIAAGGATCALAGA